MNKKWIIGILSLSLVVITLFTVANDPKTEVLKPFNLSSDFKDYWFAGDAELTRYELDKGRYGESHNGDAVLIFVTEPFLPGKQVKYDNLPTEEKPVNVLKMNFALNFFTGIYPYHIMKSVFTPLNPNNGNTLKVSMTSQDWCGHSFSQINNSEDAFEISNYSYFQKEGDTNYNLDKVLLEDEIWTLIRLQPEELPLGEIDIIPGTVAARLTHHELKVEKAYAEMIKNENGDPSNSDVSIYKLNYKNFNRSLVIKFESQSPFKILGWEETFEDMSGKTLTTKANISETIKLDYWNKNSAADSTYRKLLGL